ncbi:hypothetical protein PTMSG1_06084 [Pyrenophora teres f. maculata]|nr:hypothetical protein PTMSG1_06084 [Pyrenophora teres f. maculata]
MIQDLMDLDGDYSTSHPDNASVLRDFEGVLSKCREVMSSSDSRYEELLAKYNELESKVIGRVMQDTATPQTLTSQFVVVLVDAHSHKFMDKYIYGAESGGSQAAKLLKKATANYITEHHPDMRSNHIHARVYANLKALSTKVAEGRNGINRKLKLPHYPRSLGAFAAGFSRMDAFFDYVDVVEQGDVEQKITALFCSYIKDPQCSHIFLAASGSAKYTRLLDEHAKSAVKFTMIPGGLQDSIIYPGKQSTTFANVFEQVGNGRISTEIPTNVAKSQNKPSKVPSLHEATPYISEPSGGIPVNFDGDRIDDHMNTPTNSQWSTYEAHISKKKLCTPFYLGKGCEDRITCTYDHSPINPTITYCLRYALRKVPCRKRGACRMEGCFMGHTCRNSGCKNGKLRRCKLNPQMHDMDMRVARWVQPDEYEAGVEDEDEDEDKREVVGSEEPETSVEPCGVRTGILIDI